MEKNLNFLKFNKNKIKNIKNLKKTPYSLIRVIVSRERPWLGLRVGLEGKARAKG